MRIKDFLLTVAVTLVMVLVLAYAADVGFERQIYWEQQQRGEIK